MMDQKLILRIRSINQYIAKANTGSPKEFAAKLRISERQLYAYLGLMKKMGAPIMYCRSRCSYTYGADGQFYMGFEATPPPHQPATYSKLTVNDLPHYPHSFSIFSNCSFALTATDGSGFHYRPAKG